MIELPGLWSLTPIGFGIGVVALVYWLLVTGRLIPRATHQNIVAAERLRGDEWKGTAEKGQEVIAAQAQQITALSESTRTTAAILKASAPPGFDQANPTGGS